MIKIGIVGATGMTGESVLKILLAHPDIEITYLGSEHAAGSEVGDFIPELKGICKIKCEEINPKFMIKKADVLMLCKEAGFGMRIASELLKAGKKVIDLGPDFRFSNSAVFEKHYKMKHTADDLFKKAVYGLPELYREKISKASLVANPGCYPTGVILSLLPILEKSSFLNIQSPIFISSYSGLSGSGKKYSEVTKNLFVEAYGNLRPYNVGRHRHQPEIEQILSDASGRKVQVFFVPHTVPIDRGILSTVFLQYQDSKIQKLKISELIGIYRKFYKDEPFVRVLAEGEVAQTQAVARTNICEISVHLTAEESIKIVVISAIDNLMKGAAGQAVQNLNIMCGLDEIAGLQFRNV